MKPWGTRQGYPSSLPVRQNRDVPCLGQDRGTLPPPPFAPGQATVRRLTSSLVFLFADYHMFQYFIQVVPTKVATGQANRDTYQYAVTEKVSA